jgi:pyruvate dehydrogenase E2 component (dihydrolipoamide acetyltransferase)
VEQYLQQLSEGVPGNSNNLLTNPDKLRATPAARRLARERNLTLKQIRGSGPLGRIQVEDVARFQPRMVEAASKLVSESDSDSGEMLALSRMRRVIADRVVQNYQSIPHINFTVSVDMTAVIELRRRLNVEIEKEEAARVSVTAVLAKVCAWALERHPLVNAAWSEAGIQLHDQIKIGVAVALDDGLIVPVIQNVASLGLLKIASQLQKLTIRARSGHLQPQDVQGGTFTISNLGMFGIDQFTAIINAPQSAILAVGQTVKKPIVVETPTGDEMVIRPMMMMTLSVDHRLIDGTVAARFLQDVVGGLEQPDRMLW